MGELCEKLDDQCPRPFPLCRSSYTLYTIFGLCRRGPIVGGVSGNIGGPYHLKLPAD